MRFLLIILFCIEAITGFSQNDCIKGDTESLQKLSSLYYFEKSLKRDSFILYKDKQFLPAYALKQFYCLYNDSLIANEGEWYTQCVQIEGVPNIKLKSFGVSDSTFFITYVKGGIVDMHGVVLIRLGKNKISINGDNKKIFDVWKSQGCEQCVSSYDVLDYLKTRHFSSW